MIVLDSAKPLIAFENVLLWKKNQMSLSSGLLNCEMEIISYEGKIGT